jgi:hypothetical protein
MFENILTKEQKNILPFLKKFNSDFGLVGGTAIALHIGHRQSVDFDLFTNKEFKNSNIRRKIIGSNKKIGKVLQDQKDEYTILIENVKFTFFYYPFKIEFSENLDNIIKTPDLLTLSAMKSYALGRRSKWKDYVDLYFILKKYHSLNDIIEKSKEIFGLEFNEKIFRTQLSYFEDIDYSEEVSFMEGWEVNDETIKNNLTEFILGI